MRYECKQNPLASNEVMRNVKFHSEGVYALVCIAEGLDVHYEIEVGSRLIDFWVEDPDTGEGKLVEVTTLSRDLFNNKRKPQGLRETVMVEHKLQQIKAMEESGLPWEVVFGEDLEEIWEKIDLQELFKSMANHPKYKMLAKFRELDTPRP